MLFIICLTPIAFHSYPFVKKSDKFFLLHQTVCITSDRSARKLMSTTAPNFSPISQLRCWPSCPGCDAEKIKNKPLRIELLKFLEFSLTYQNLSVNCHQNLSVKLRSFAKGRNFFIFVNLINFVFF